MKYKTILIDPPWEEQMAGQYNKTRHKRPFKLPYGTMTLPEIEKLPISDYADTGCHLWLWTTNSHLNAGFKLINIWDFKYLAPITWVKPSGLGNWFIHRTQHILFAYKEKCIFPLDRYKPNVIFASPIKHSKKPQEAYNLIESISPPPRLEIFARDYRNGWHVWGDEVAHDIDVQHCTQKKFKPQQLIIT